ncbi:unnamed protein product [Musa acuminata var. zebrina]
MNEVQLNLFIIIMDGEACQNSVSDAAIVAVSASAAVVAAAALQAAVLISGRLSSASSGKKEVSPEQLIEATS